MKKLLFVFSLLLIFPPCVFAESKPKVLTLKAETSGSTIGYKGTMEDGSTAVMCKLYNSEGEEIDMLSTAVEENKFEGTFTVTSKGEYKISCANYEGGDFKDVTVSAEGDDVPNTYDRGIYSSVILLIMCALGFATLAIYKKNND